VLAARLEALVVVVHRHRQDLLRRFLPDHVLVEDLPDLVRRRQLAAVGARRFTGRAFLADDVIAELDALVADEHRRPGDQLAHLVLALAAERAVEKLVAGGGLVCHLGRCLRSGGACDRLYPAVALFCKTLSTSPYSLACSAVRKLSRSVSRATCSTGLPVCSAISWFSRSRRLRMYLAWISTSDAWPWNPPRG